MLCGRERAMPAEQNHKNAAVDAENAKNNGKLTQK